MGLGSKGIEVPASEELGRMASFANKDVVVGVPNMAVAPSAPGAAESSVVREEVLPISAPSWRFEEEPRAGGGVKEPEASPRGLGEAVTVPSAP